jgi:heat shock protein HtpX
VATKSGKTLFEVEREERWRVWALFGLLVGAVFVPLVPIAFVADVVARFMIQFHGPSAYWSTQFFLPLSPLLREAVLVAAGLALVISLVSWLTSGRRRSARLLRALGAMPMDPEDRYHQRLQRIVEELCVAAGVPAAVCVVVPGLAMNAFSFSDVRGRACIGVTEGALARLSRQQLQAVVAHEVAHVASRDCVTATRACLLFLGVVRAEHGVGWAWTTDLTWRRDSSVAQKVGGLGVVAVYLLWPVTLLVWLGLRCTELMASIVNLAISRRREFLADLAAARFTRDPVSLAEALQLMAGHRGAREPIPAGLSPLCICPVGATGVDAGGGWRSTHPPLAARVEHLLAFARRQGIDSGQRAIELARGLQSREHVVSTPARRAETLDGLVAGAAPSGRKCPACGAGLHQVSYEGTAIMACLACGGRALHRPQVDAILARREIGFTQEQAHLADLAEEGRAAYEGLFKGGLENREGSQDPGSSAAKAAPLVCPVCNSAMTRGIWTPYYRVPIDHCERCGLIWFDGNELEVLQILVERQTS